eukprot:350535-Chlamydomonas_euryale.AAC.2
MRARGKATWRNGAFGHLAQRRVWPPGATARPAPGAALLETRSRSCYYAQQLLRREVNMSAGGYLFCQRGAAGPQPHSSMLHITLIHTQGHDHRVVAPGDC